MHRPGSARRPTRRLCCTAHPLACRPGPLRNRRGVGDAPALPRLLPSGPAWGLGGMGHRALVAAIANSPWWNSPGAARPLGLVSAEPWWMQSPHTARNHVPTPLNAPHPGVRPSCHVLRATVQQARGHLQGQGAGQRMPWGVDAARAVKGYRGGSARGARPCARRGCALGRSVIRGSRVSSKVRASAATWHTHARGRRARMQAVAGRPPNRGRERGQAAGCTACGTRVPPHVKRWPGGE